MLADVSRHNTHPIHHTQNRQHGTYQNAQSRPKGGQISVTLSPFLTPSSFRVVVSGSVLGPCGTPWKQPPVDCYRHECTKRPYNWLPKPRFQGQLLLVQTPWTLFSLSYSFLTLCECSSEPRVYVIACVPLGTWKCVCKTCPEMMSHRIVPQSQPSPGTYSNLCCSPPCSIFPSLVSSNI